MNLMEASNQWRSRPADERFLSLPDAYRMTKALKERSGSTVLASKALKVAPAGETTIDHNGIVVIGPKGNPVVPTHWAFSQLGSLAKVPVGYFRDSNLPAPIVADCFNWGLLNREVEDLGVLVRKEDGYSALAAATGPAYGRIWNADVFKALIERFGDGVNGPWRVPGEFGKRVEITKENTTIYASDRDMFVFLADEERRIEVPGRRADRMGTFARGFFMKNSEVGAGKVEITGFINDYTCCNRIVWGAEDVVKIEIRHTSGGPARWLAEAAPALKRYSEASTKTLTVALEEARKHKLGEDVAKFLNERFTKSQTKQIMEVHLKEEGRPIESRWDAAVGITAFARSIPWIDERVKLEREAGKLLPA